MANQESSNGGVGIPSGMLVDNKGPRPSILIGATCLFIGYYPIYLGKGGCRVPTMPTDADEIYREAMLHGRGSTSVPVLCFFSALTGVGSCCSFGGALKMGTYNITHRPPYYRTADIGVWVDSGIELASSPWHGYSHTISSLRIERLFLLLPFLVAFSGQHCGFPACPRSGDQRAYLRSFLLL
jgi:hypothetical protein